MVILGITGTLGAGKGTIVEYLKKKDFEHYSVRDFLTNEIKKRKLQINRDNMVSVANDLRHNFGSSYIVEKLYEKALQKEKNAIIESIRNVGEVKALKNKNKKFFLVAIDADTQKRYQRIKKRGSNTDNVSFEKFVEQEKREMQTSDPTKQNLSACIELADIKIYNNSSFVDLENKIEEKIINIIK